MGCKTSGNGTLSPNFWENVKNSKFSNLHRAIPFSKVIIEKDVQ